MKLDPLIERLLEITAEFAEIIRDEIDATKKPDPRSQRVAAQLRLATNDIVDAVKVYKTMHADMKLEANRKR